MSLVKLFNSQFTDFLQDMISVFPEDKDIKTAKFMHSNMCSLTPSVPIKLWYSNIYVNYYDDLEKDGFNSLYTKNFEDVVNTYDDANTILEMIHLIKTRATTLSDSNKDKVLQYMINLCKISKMYHTSS